jgi:hypothetical protein
MSEDILKLSKSGMAPGINSFKISELAWNVRLGKLYGMIENADGTREVRLINATESPFAAHARNHSIISTLDHDAADSLNYNKLVATNALTGAIEYIDKPAAFVPTDHILDWDGSKYLPYPAKKSTDPGFAYLYTNVSAVNWPTLTHRICFDGILYATMMISGTNSANAGFQTKLMGLSDVYNGYYNYFNLATNDNVNKLIAYADVNETTSISNPILIGDNSTYHGRKSEHLIIDPANQRFDINMSKTRLTRGIASKFLGTDVNKEIVYLDADYYNSWDVKVDSSSALPIYKTGSLVGYKGVKFMSGAAIELSTTSDANGFLVITINNVGSVSGVSSFNTRSGVVTLTKADVESVLTGLITSHTHNYDNYANWKIAWFNLGTDGVDYFNINSTNSVEFLGGENVSIPTPTVSGSKTTVTINSTAQSTLASFYTDSANISTAETNAFSYTLPANKLKSNGSRLELYYDGIFANNTDQKTIRVYFGTTVISSIINTTLTGTWRLILRLVRTSTSNIRVSCELFYNGESWSSGIDYGSQNFATANNMKITLQSATGSNDIIAKTGIITFNP